MVLKITLDLKNDHIFFSNHKKKGDKQESREEGDGFTNFTRR